MLVSFVIWTELTSYPGSSCGITFYQVMASKSGNDEDEKDFLVCGICMDYYDDGVRTPKILECFHSCCITCLKVIFQAKNVKILLYLIS
jgi:hypothetical protein